MGDSLIYVIINQLKRFTLNISVESYKTKEDARMCLFSKGAQSIGRVKMAFRECSVTVDQFLNCATNGHTFCALFDYDPLQYYWFEDNLGKKHKSSSAPRTPAQSSKHKQVMTNDMCVV